ncbi:MAG: hypothetical protein GIS02_06265 [Methanosarcinales archaeon]|uniref:Uncharacterized protein n=1 Tax=Candidatus Ethanoperedens thermophilum TaxID=2766897 RepID=A0A848D9T0_9EURY|nr:hypothetical protein [Candidatus Ethanoperedens thermophilum]
MNNDNCYYGWIPILTKDLLFGYFIKELENEKKMVEGEEKKKLDKRLSKTSGRYYIHETHEDVKDKKFKVIISVDDRDAIDHIFIFKYSNPTLSDKNIAAEASCNIEDNGLVTLKLEYPEEKVAWKEHEIIKQVYIIIREVYHHHTHHEPQEEILLQPVSAKDKTDAIIKIINQYQEKIISYHTLIRTDIKCEGGFDDARNLVAKAKEEMAYASAFVNTFERNIKDPQSYFFVFSNALKPIDGLASDIE